MTGGWCDFLRKTEVYIKPWNEDDVSNICVSVIEEKYWQSYRLNEDTVSPFQFTSFSVWVWRYLAPPTGFHDKCLVASGYGCPIVSAVVEPRRELKVWSQISNYFPPTSTF